MDRHEKVYRNKGKKIYNFLSNQVELLVINLTYYITVVGILLKKAEAGIRKENTALLSCKYCLFF